jgi:protein SDA1
MAAGGERWETRMAMASVVSRSVGTHRLLLLNFYPWVQRYLAPGQRDVTQLMAILVQVRQGSKG